MYNMYFCFTRINKCSKIIINFVWNIYKQYDPKVLLNYFKHPQTCLGSNLDIWWLNDGWGKNST